MICPQSDIFRPEWRLVCPAFLGWLCSSLLTGFSCLSGRFQSDGGSSYSTTLVSPFQRQAHATGRGLMQRPNSAALQKSVKSARRLLHQAGDRPAEGSEVQLRDSARRHREVQARRAPDSLRGRAEEGAGDALTYITRLEAVPSRYRQRLPGARV